MEEFNKLKKYITNYDQVLQDIEYYTMFFDGFRVFKCFNPDGVIIQVYPPKGISPKQDKLLENKYLYELLKEK